MTFTTIEYGTRDGIARIALNRPDKLNSFNETMHAELRTALTAAPLDGARVLVITGRGRGFCAGQDLGDRGFQREAGNLGATLERNYNRLARMVTALEMPVIAAVNGVAAGAGANLALACDIVIATRSASFVQAFCKIGLVPDCGGTWTLPRLAGRARAMGLALLGDKLTAEQAAQWGMIWECVDDERFEARVDALAAHLAVQPTLGLGMIKQAINASFSNTLDQQLDLERDLQQSAGRTWDYGEGVQAFMQKRKPEFRGS